LEVLLENATVSVVEEREMGNWPRSANSSRITVGARFLSQLKTFLLRYLKMAKSEFLALQRWEPTFLKEKPPIFILSKKIYSRRTNNFTKNVHSVGKCAV
jgi:hypothetical protein